MKFSTMVRSLAASSCYSGLTKYVTEADEPTEPLLKTIDVNLKGTLYTTKLAMHYFIKCNGDKSSTAPSTSTSTSKQAEDTCLILIGSGAAFLDCPRAVEYGCTKFGVRGIMHNLRRMTHYYTSRVNVISPWYVRTNILSSEAFDAVQKEGVEFAKAADGGDLALRIMSDDKVNGHSFFLAPRKWANKGYVDLDPEDYTEDTAFLREVQRMQMAGVEPEKGLFLS